MQGLYHSLKTFSPDKIYQFPVCFMHNWRLENKQVFFFHNSLPPNLYLKINKTESDFILQMNRKNHENLNDWII